MQYFIIPLLCLGHIEPSRNLIVYAFQYPKIAKAIFWMSLCYSALHNIITVNKKLLKLIQPPPSKWMLTFSTNHMRLGTTPFAYIYTKRTKRIASSADSKTLPTEWYPDKFDMGHFKVTV